MKGKRFTRQTCGGGGDGGGLGRRRGCGKVLGRMGPGAEGAGRRPGPGSRGKGMKARDGLEKQTRARA